MEKKELIERYFEAKYPDERYVMKGYYHIADIFGCDGNKLYIIEFVDTQINHSKKMEMQVRENELLNFHL